MATCYLLNDQRLIPSDEIEFMLGSLNKVLECLTKCSYDFEQIRWQVLKFVTYRDAIGKMDEFRSVFKTYRISLNDGINDLIRVFTNSLQKNSYSHRIANDDDVQSIHTTDNTQLPSSSFSTANHNSNDLTNDRIRIHPLLPLQMNDEGFLNNANNSVSDEHIPLNSTQQQSNITKVVQEQIQENGNELPNENGGIRAEDIMEIVEDSLDNVDVFNNTDNDTANNNSNNDNDTANNNSNNDTNNSPKDIDDEQVIIKEFGCATDVKIVQPKLDREIEEIMRKLEECTQNGSSNGTVSEGLVASEMESSVQKESESELDQKNGDLNKNIENAKDELEEDASEDDGGMKSDSDTIESAIDSESELNSLIKSCKKELNNDDDEQTSSSNPNKSNKAEKLSKNSKWNSKNQGDYGAEYMYETDEEGNNDGDGEQHEGNEENNTAESSERTNDEPEDKPEDVKKTKGGGEGRGISTEEPKKESKKAKVRDDFGKDTEENTDDKGSEEHDEMDEENVVVIKRSKVDKLLAKRIDLSDSEKEEESDKEMEKDANERHEKGIGNKSKKKKRKIILSSESESENAVGDSGGNESSDDDSFAAIGSEEERSGDVESNSSETDSDERKTRKSSESGKRNAKSSKKKKEYATRSKQKAKKRARIEEDSSDDGDNDDSDAAKSDMDSDIMEVNDDDDKGDKNDGSPKKRRGAKPIMGKDKLTKATVDAEKAEKERRKRIEAKQREFNGIELVQGTSANDLASALTESSSQSIHRLKSVVLDRDEHSDEPCPVSVHQSLVKCLKKHQAEGIQFLYNCTIESLERLNKDEGGGAILAHCMGLGKTLQVIAFLHTIMMHPKISRKVKRVLVVVPKNVVLNWYKEFEKWLDNENIDRDLDTINVMELDTLKEYSDRHSALKTWYENDEPSVMIIGYDMFRILTRDEDDNNNKSKKNETKRKPSKPSKQARKLLRLQPDFRKFLQDPGPDLIVCDEAHKLKNDESTLTKTMKKIQTKRRICLTGTPLQNNLIEYHCMVSFVKQGLLGTKSEFSNRFANVINRGRLKDATAAEVRFMKRRCHVLYEHLKGIVQRVDYRVLMDSIPPKQEYVINVRLTPNQVKLYRCFLERVGQDSTGLSKRLLPDYHILSRIWTHPHQLIAHEIVVERKRLFEDDKDDLEDFIDEGDESPSVIETSDDDVVALDDLNGDDDAVASTSKIRKSDPKATRKSRRLAGEDTIDDDLNAPPTPPEIRGWYAKTGLVSADDENNFNLSNKLLLLAAIIKKCEEIGDKLLVFSQSIESLTLIKRMLHYMDSHGLWFADGHEAIKSAKETWGWTEGHDYLVIDGQVQSGKRQEVQTTFNNPNNFRARLMLISTRAGSLGTNMVAANRVIIFDACWNPSHDTQSLFRVYRFGQTKPVYIYRFIAQGTMEERIYKRQVTKESTSLRVIDEQQIQRHFDGHDLMELYKFDPDELNEDTNENGAGSSQSRRPQMAPPKDRLLRDIILSHQDAIVNYLQHDSLFEDIEEEKLTEQECQEAWEDYEREKTMVAPNRGVYLPYEHQLAADQNHVMMMAKRMNDNNQMLYRLQTDEVFVQAFTVPGMEQDFAMKLAYMKISLDSLLPHMSTETRGGITGFGLFFLGLIREIKRENQTPQELMDRALRTFREVVELTRNTPACQPLLRHLYRSSNQFFDPTRPPP